MLDLERDRRIRQAAIEIRESVTATRRGVIAAIEAACVAHPGVQVMRVLALAFGDTGYLGRVGDEDAIRQLDAFALMGEARDV